MAAQAMPTNNAMKSVSEFAGSTALDRAEQRGCDRPLRMPHRIVPALSMIETVPVAMSCKPGIVREVEAFALSVDGKTANEAMTRVDPSRNSPFPGPMAGEILLKELTLDP
jgi:hypothetical protein